MKKQIIFLLILFFAVASAFKSSYILTIEIDKLENNKGRILLEFCDDKKNVLKEISEKIENNRCIITIENLKPGKYSFRYFHDEDMNNELGTNWLGIPNEGYGFSNNATGTFGPPSFEKTLFTVKSDTTLKCTPEY